MTITSKAPRTSTSQTSTQTTARALIRAMRPRQWTKNMLVFAGPFVAGSVFVPHNLLVALIAMICFCFAASGTYLVNDLRDVDADRAHPTKRMRPIAAGTLGATVAGTVAVALWVTAVLAAGLLVDWSLALVVVAYIVVQVGYCFWLKNQPVIDLAAVSSGFVLRAVAGAVATETPLSQWFLLTAAFGSLFMVSGKRFCEKELSVTHGTIIRESLKGYTSTFLRFAWSLSATILVVTYALWSLEFRGVGVSATLAELSLVPFVLAVLRYAAEIDRGTAGAPEEIALSDRTLIALAGAWLMLLVGAVYF